MNSFYSESHTYSSKNGKIQKDIHRTNYNGHIRMKGIIHGIPFDYDNHTKRILNINSLRKRNNSFSKNKHTRKTVGGKRRRKNKTIRKK